MKHITIWILRKAEDAVERTSSVLCNALWRARAALEAKPSRPVSIGELFRDPSEEKVPGEYGEVLFGSGKVER